MFALAEESPGVGFTVLVAIDAEAVAAEYESVIFSLTDEFMPGTRGQPRQLREKLRQGFAELFEIVSADGVLESGGCVSQFSASLVAALLEAGVYDDHVVTLRRTYAARRDALAGALRKELPAGCSFTVPAGGFFLWVRLPRGLTASKLLPVAERHRVGLAPGHRFCIDGDDRHLRLPFSLYDAASLAEGARRLAAAIGEAMAGAS